MKDWEIEVEHEHIKDGDFYFITKRRDGPSVTPRLLLSKYLSGKRTWSEKPGIAIQFVGNDDLRKTMKENPDCVAIAVPHDAEKRWKRRRPKTLSKKFRKGA